MKHFKETIFIVLLSLAWAHAVWVNSYDDFSSAETFGFFFYCILLLLLQFVAYFLVRLLRLRLGHSRPWEIALLGVFATFNFYTLILVNTDVVLMTNLAKGLSLSVLAALFSGVLHIVANSKSPPWVLYALILVFFGHNTYVFLQQKEVAIDQAGKMKLPVTPPPGLFTQPEFKIKPNVYLISFDALIPEAIARDHLGIVGLKYVEEIKRQGFRILRNSFSDGSSIVTMNSLVAMDARYYYSATKSNGRISNRFVNNIQSPLYQIFKQNGYKVQLMTKNSYLGGKSHNLDYRGVADRRATACEHVKLHFSLMGYCHPRVQEVLKRMDKNRLTFPGALFARIGESARDSTPWLTIGYIFSPGHIDPELYVWPRDFKKYRKEFERMRDARAADYIKSLVNIVKERDPTGILIIFGDHGTHYSRTKRPKWGGTDLKGVMLDTINNKEELIREVQDHHGVMIAIYPADFCKEEFDREPYSLIRLGRSVVKCLSGQDPMPPAHEPDDDFLNLYRYE